MGALSFHGATPVLPHMRIELPRPLTAATVMKTESVVTNELGHERTKRQIDGRGDRRSGREDRQGCGCEDRVWLRRQRCGCDDRRSYSRGPNLTHAAVRALNNCAALNLRTKFGKKSGAMAKAKAAKPPKAAAKQPQPKAVAKQQPATKPAASTSKPDKAADGIPRCPQCGDMCLVLASYDGVCTVCYAGRRQWNAVAEKTVPTVIESVAALASNDPKTIAAVKLQAAARGRRARRWVRGQLLQRSDGKLDRKPSRGLLRSASAMLEKKFSLPSRSTPGRQSRRLSGDRNAKASDVKGTAGKEPKTIRATAAAVKSSVFRGKGKQTKIAGQPVTKV